MPRYQWVDAPELSKAEQKRRKACACNGEAMRDSRDVIGVIVDTTSGAVVARMEPPRTRDGYEGAVMVAFKANDEAPTQNVTFLSEATARAGALLLLEEGTVDPWALRNRY